MWWCRWNFDFDGCLLDKRVQRSVAKGCWSMSKGELLGNLADLLLRIFCPCRKGCFTCRRRRTRLEISLLSYRNHRRQSGSGLSVTTDSKARHSTDWVIEGSWKIYLQVGWKWLGSQWIGRGGGLKGKSCSRVQHFQDRSCDPITLTSVIDAMELWSDQTNHTIKWPIDR